MNESAPSSSENTVDLEHPPETSELSIKRQELALARQSLLFDFLKWLVGGAVIVCAFLLIRPREQSRLDLELKRDLFNGYIQSQDSADLQTWRRKLDLLEVFFTSMRDGSFDQFFAKEHVRINAGDEALKKDKQRQTEESAVLQELVLIETTHRKIMKRLETPGLPKSERDTLQSEADSLQKRSTILQKRLSSQQGITAPIADALTGPPLYFDPGDKVISNVVHLKHRDSHAIAQAIRGFEPPPEADNRYPYTYAGKLNSVDRAAQVQITVLDERTIVLRGPRAGIEVVTSIIAQMDDVAFELLDD